MTPTNPSIKAGVYISDADLCCPSAQPGMPESRIIGIVAGTPEKPRLSFLPEPVAPTAQVLELASPVTPTEVFRFAARCQTTTCSHFDGSRCRLANQIVQILPVVSEFSPACRLRSVCRWFSQEGRHACVRCPQIVTETYSPTTDLKMAATPWSEQESTATT